MAKYKEGDHVVATIGRRDIPDRERHPAIVTHVTPEHQLGDGVVHKLPDGTEHTASPQTYHVKLTDTPVDPKTNRAADVSFAVDEDDLEPAPAPVEAQ